MRRIAIAIPLLLALAACEGPTGPVGPPGLTGATGPQGPAGPQGGGVRFVATGVIDEDGTAAAEFPAGAGSLEDLPVASCYQSETGAVWLPVTDLLCGLVESMNGNLAIVMVQGEPGWLFYFVAVF